MPHQVEAVDFAMARKGSLLYLKQGTGKTLIGLGLANLHRHTLVVCPKSLVANWVAEKKKAFPNLTIGEFTSAMKRKTASKKLVERMKELLNKDVVVCSYESTVKLPKKLQESFDLVVLDECQRIKNKQTQHSKAIYKLLVKYDPRIVLLSGTPFPNGVHEAWGVYRMLENEEFQFTEEYPNLRRFQQDFQILKRNQLVRGRRGTISIPVFEGFRNKEKFYKLFGPVTFNKKVDLGLGTLTQSELSVTTNIPDSVIDQLREAFFESGRDLENFQTARRLSAMSKAGAAAEYLLDAGEPAVCFSCYPDALKDVKKVLEKAGKKVAFVNQGTKDRQREVDKFQSGKVDFILGTSGTMAEGYTLTRAALVVLIDLDVRPKINEQAIYRIYRKGQTKACRAIYLSHSDVDTRIIKLVRGKVKVLDAIERDI